jgi:F-type H+-transporting ATPase subunit c
MFDLSGKTALVTGASGAIGGAIGVGNIFGSFLDGALRNPSAAPAQTGNLFVGAALAEALGLFSIVLGFVILFAA